MAGIKYVVNICLNSHTEISMQTCFLIQQAVRHSCLQHSGCKGTMLLYPALVWTLPRGLQVKVLFRLVAHYCTFVRCWMLKLESFIVY